MNGPVGWWWEAIDASIARRLDAFFQDDAPATPAALRSLAAAVDDVGARVDGLRQALVGVRSLKDQIASLRDEPADGDARVLRRLSLRARDESIEHALLDLRGRVRAVADALSGADQRVRDALGIDDEALALSTTASTVLQQVLATLGPAGHAPAPKPAASGSASAEREPAPPDEAVCRVPGCGKPVKARGFCSRHYGQWYRGRLPGWVQADGLVRLEDGSRWRVDTSLAGEPVERGPDGPWVAGQRVDAHPVR